MNRHSDHLGLPSVAGGAVPLAIAGDHSRWLQAYADALGRIQAGQQAALQGRVDLAQARMQAAAARLTERAHWLEASLKHRHAALASRLAAQSSRWAQDVAQRAQPLVMPNPAPAGVGSALARLAPAAEGVFNAAAPLPPAPAPAAPPSGLSAVLGQAALKRLLHTRFVLPLREPSRAALYRQRSQGGVLMYGPPGTGKTFIARALAAELALPVFTLSAAAVLSKWLGESEKQLAQVFAQARQHPAALMFIDEIDALAPSRDGPGESQAAMQRLLTQLLTELDGFERKPGHLVFLAATNRPWALDAALLRPGRLDALAFVGLPDAATRVALLQRGLQGVPQVDSLDWPAAAQALAGCTAAEAQACAEQAARAAFEDAVRQGRNRPVAQADLMAAAQVTPRSVSAETLLQHAAFARTHGLPPPDAAPVPLAQARPPRFTLQPAAAPTTPPPPAQAAAGRAASEPPLDLQPQPPLLPFRFVQARDLELEIDALPMACYAMQHAGIATISDLSLHNQGGEASQNLLVEVSLLPDDYGPAWSCTVAELPAGQRWHSGPIQLPLRLERLRAVQEREAAQLRVTVRDKAEVLLARSQPLPVLAYNEWVYLPKFLQLAAAFVQPNSPALHPLVQAAAERLRAATGSAALPGYQMQSPQHVLRMLEALHDTLAQHTHLAYINPPPSFEFTGQKIRLVADTLAQGRGTCLDLAILQAALWEHVGLHPCLVLVPGHAMLGCWMVDRCAAQPVVSLGKRSKPAQALREALASGELRLFNSVEVAHGQPLEAAQRQAADIVQAVLARGEEVQLIDVHASRSQVTPLP